jgi:hypothetical protein
MFIDKKFRVPRIWSNRELRRFAGLFEGDIVNVSGWKDMDKEGGFYRDYFSNASTYTITNYNPDKTSCKEKEPEIVLDLENRLPDELVSRFDVVFNHTVLEHVYDFRTAFHNLCLMTRDIVIIVVPFLQQMHVHDNYGDYWRFSPLALKRMFEEEGLQILYSSFNENVGCSVYLFFIASKQPCKWTDSFPPFKFTHRTSRRFLLDDFNQNHTGCRSIKNNLITSIVNKLRWKKIKMLPELWRQANH